MTRLRAEAFAKINRSLKVLALRPDGYHELDTVFQTIDLADALEMEEGAGSLEIRTDDPAVPSDERNLVYRAGALLAERFGVPLSARVKLTKRIPAGAGLGGGSSNAAIALVLFARLWGLPLVPEVAAEAALELGSDVPFFLRGGAARGRGRGEILTDLPEEGERRILLVVPPFSLSTARVYEARLQKIPPGAPQGEDKNLSPGRFFGENDLAPAVQRLEPSMARYRETLTDFFPDCGISGSGSCLAALVEPGGERRIPELRRRLPEAALLLQKTLSRSEYRQRSTVDFQKEVVHP